MFTWQGCSMGFVMGLLYLYLLLSVSAFLYVFHIPSFSLLLNYHCRNYIDSSVITAVRSGILLFSWNVLGTATLFYFFLNCLFTEHIQNLTLVFQCYR